MKKKLVAVLVGILMMEAMPVTLFANDIGLVINNKVINEGAKPVQEQGTTLVPLRVVSTSLGASVDYVNGHITITKGVTKIELEIGSVQATINGKETTMSLAPQRINGTTYVPIRFVSENLECSVNWKSDIRVVEIIEKLDNKQEVEVENNDCNNIDDAKEYDEQLEKDYNEFKNMFSVQRTEVTVDNEILYDVKYIGSMGKNEFWEKWQSINNKDEFAKRMGREIREKNPTYTSALYFKYSGTSLGYVFAYPPDEYYSNGYELNSFTLNPFGIHNIQ